MKSELEKKLVGMKVEVDWDELHWKIFLQEHVPVTPDWVFWKDYERAHQDRRTPLEGLN